MYIIIIIVILNEWLYFFIARFLISSSSELTALLGFCFAGATWNCCRLGASSMYTIQPVYNVI